MRLGLVLGCVCVLLAVQECHGQTAARAFQRYQPVRPTVSPYLSLTRRGESGGLPNYYAFVRPAQATASRETFVEGAFRAQTRSLLQVEGELLRITAPPTGRASQFMVQGARGRHRDYSHFYRDVRPPSAGQ